MPSKPPNLTVLTTATAASSNYSSGGYLIKYRHAALICPLFGVLLLFLFLLLLLLFLSLFLWLMLLRLSVAAYVRPRPGYGDSYYGPCCSATTTTAAAAAAVFAANAFAGFDGAVRKSVSV